MGHGEHVRMVLLRGSKKGPELSSPDSLQCSSAQHFASPGTEPGIILLNGSCGHGLAASFLHQRYEHALDLPTPALVISGDCAPADRGEEMPTESPSHETVPGPHLRLPRCRHSCLTDTLSYLVSVH